jgi:uncharacterized protein (TIGR03086 family)
MQRYMRVADSFEQTLRGLLPDKYSNPSPCSDWTAREVADHVIDTHTRVLTSVATLPPSGLGDDESLLKRWSTVRMAVSTALANSEVAATPVSGLFGEQSFESLVSRLLIADTLVHTWDLAQAIGREVVLDQVAVTKALEFLTPLDEAIRVPGGFAPKIEPPAGADDVTRLMNFCGRATP